MTPTPRMVQGTYYTLTLLTTLAQSFIWGINTLFLLDAGLSNLEAFAANAFFTAGQVIFEVPTGVVADTLGRRTSYALGALTLLVATAAYWWLWVASGPFWAWALVSALLGLGYTFFSGATEAWLVDALQFAKFRGTLDSVFGTGQAIGGVAMLIGSVGGGFLAQVTDLGVPYLARAGILGLTFVVCLLFMRDWGFAPQRGRSPLGQVKAVLRGSIEHGLRNPPVRWVMLAAPFSAGAGFYIFYALQPYLLELYGDPSAYGVAGLAAAIIAGSQIVGGLSIRLVQRWFATRTSLLISTAALGTIAVLLLGLIQQFWIALGLVVAWGLLSALAQPVRQSFLNGLIPSKERATVLSFDSLLGNTGGVVVQPVLGRVADVAGYAPSYLVSALFQAGALPFLLAARAQRAASDPIEGAR